MAHRASLPTLIAAGLALGLGGCQSMFGNDENQTVAAYDARLARPNSAQRLDENGFPLLGAYPGAAAPQLDSNAVAADRARLMQSAAARAPGGSAAATYNAALQDAAAVRQAQRLAVDRALSGIGGASDAAPRTPADDLRGSQSQ